MANDKDDFKENLSSLMFDDRLENEAFVDTPAFEAEHTQQLIDKLQHLSRFGNLLTLVLGERGSGKSYTIDQLLDVIHEESDVCHIKAQPMLTTAQLFQAIQNDFLAETGTAIDNDTFQNVLDDIEPPHVNRVLIVDDADTLSAEVLTSLCQLSADEQEKDSPFLKIILFANHDLNLSIETAASGILPDTGIYTLDIPGLSDTDAHNWVNYVLQQQGYAAEQDEIESIVDEGGENFNDLERLAVDYIDEAAEEVFVEEEPEQPKVSMLGYWFAGLTIVVLAVLGGFFYQDELSDLLFPEEPAPVIVEEAISVSKPVPADQVVEEVITESSDEMMATTSPETTTLTTDSSELTTVDSTSPDSVENTEVSGAETDMADESDTPVGQVDTEENLDPVIEPPLTATSTGSSDVEQIAPVTDTPSAAVADVKQVEQKLEPEPLPEPEPEYTVMEERLLALPDDGYVVQIIGLTNPAAIDKLLSAHADLDLVYYRSLLGDKPWQVVVMAGFSSYAEASQQRQALPEKLSVNQPWIKSISKVKDEIRAAVQ